MQSKRKTHNISLGTEVFLETRATVAQSQSTGLSIEAQRERNHYITSPSVVRGRESRAS